MNLYKQKYARILAELLISSLMPFLPADLTCTKIRTCAYSVSTTCITFRYRAAICIVMRHFIFPAFGAMYISFVVTGIPSAVTLYEKFYNLIISCYCYKIIFLFPSNIVLVYLLTLSFSAVQAISFILKGVYPCRDR